jgi:ATP-binding cassette subfamily B protein
VASYLAAIPKPKSSRMNGEALTRVLDLGLPKQRSRLALPLMVSALSAVAHLIQGFLFVSTVNSSGAASSANGSSQKPNLLPPAIASLAATIIDMWVAYHRKRIWERVGQETTHRLRRRLLANLEQQDLSFYDKHGMAQLIGNITADTAKIGSFVEKAGQVVIESLLTLVITGAMVLAVSLPLALVLSIPLVFIMLPSRLLARRAAQRYAKAAQAAGQFNRMLQSSMAGVVDVKSFTAERFESSRLNAADAELTEYTIAAADVSFLEGGWIQGILSAGLSITSSYAGYLAAMGKIKQSAHFRVLFFFPRLLDALRGVEEITGLYHDAIAAAERLAVLYESRPAIRSGPRRLARSLVQGRIVFENVTFGYDPSVKVLENISFEIEPMQTVALVGRTGSGKTTLIRLLMRFYEADSGRILLDGHDIRELRLEDLRGAIALANQEAYLFESSLFDNVQYGRPGASEAQVADALATAAIDFTGSNLGKVTVGERGSHLSAGQRQRVAIARALVKEAPVLALDEITSHLDYETEAAVKQSIIQAARGKSVLVIAHRLATIRHADQIIVLDKGRIVEQGSHDHLLAQHGIYSEFWNLQTGR